MVSGYAYRDLKRYQQGGDIRRHAIWPQTPRECRGGADDARGYNELVGAWHDIGLASLQTFELGTQSTLGM